MRFREPLAPNYTSANPDFPMNFFKCSFNNSLLNAFVGGRCRACWATWSPGCSERLRREKDPVKPVGGEALSGQDARDRGSGVGERKCSIPNPPYFTWEAGP